MSSKRLSPTASLLRASRLFSLPPPLPRPDSESSSAVTFNSDTATAPYPTHAAIATPKSSLVRGDWGLKRPLPLRSTTRTSTPTIQISAVDSLEHITEFDSAGGHAITLRKYQEYNLPVSQVTGERRPSGSGSRSFDPRTLSGFEGNYDDTDLTGRETVDNERRWKYRGPWLPGKTEGEFMKYLRSQIRSQKGDFREFVRQDAARRKAADRRRIATERGDAPPTDGTAASSEIADDELQDYIVSLRKDENRLNELIQNFLDLPAYSMVPGSDDFGTASFLRRSVAMSAETEPPTTHPSAGLSYLRTASHIANHPILGPQEHHRPVQARVLIAPQSVTGRRNLAKLGVGGIVTEGQFHITSKPNETIPGVTVFDPKVEGGGKMWVHPIHVEVDADGRIKLSISRANDLVVAIHADGSESRSQGKESTATTNSVIAGSDDRPGKTQQYPLPANSELEELYSQARDSLREPIT
ncbi:MAG: hypothetical protein M1837_006900 [Sclerophora amabilis]|nr:MAG: hypothetical protein M1837_006900 [Sclerophora amabilis]